MQSRAFASASILLLVLGAGGLFLAGPGTGCQELFLSSREVPDSAADDPMAYESLSDERQQVFRQTLNESRVPVDSATAQELSGEYVTYQSRTYLLERTLVECRADPVFTLGGRLALGAGLLGLLVAAVARYRE